MQPFATTSTAETLKARIETAIPGAAVEVSSSSPGHYGLVVASETFRGRTMLESHRMVYAAIGALMAGDAAPVHAIDSLKTIAT